MKKYILVVAAVIVAFFGLATLVAISSWDKEKSAEYQNVSRVLVSVISSSTLGLTKREWDELRKDFITASLEYKLSKKLSSEEIRLLDKISSDMATVKELWDFEDSSPSCAKNEEECVAKKNLAIQSILKRNKHMSNEDRFFYESIIDIHLSLKYIPEFNADKLPPLNVDFEKLKKLSIVGEFMDVTKSSIVDYFGYHGLKIE